MRAVVQYDGTNFSGLQFQPAARTVAGELERTFSSVLRHEVKISAAGRTDAGVHASGQVVSWKTGTAFPFERFALAANAELPADVAVRAVAAVDDRFSARFSAIERTYIYAVHNAPEPSALLARYAFHVWSTFDLERLATAAQHLVGEHDFRSFCGSLPQSGPTIRTLTALRARRRANIIRIEIRADGFLHRMVRTIVGTLVECAVGRRDPASVADVLRARDRVVAGMTAPPQGLYLAGVRYRDGFDSFAEPPVTSACS